MERIKFKNNQIFEINGSSKVDFEGVFSPKELADKLKNEWIPYYDCHKCGKGDYCKFAIRYSTKPLRTENIQCGVAVEALKNFILRTSTILLNKTAKEKQYYLDASFSYCKYIMMSEQLNGAFIDTDKLDYYGMHSMKYFSEIIPIRDVLNDFGANLKKLSELYTGTSMLLVEGDTEKTFIEYAKGDGSYSRLWDFIVVNYKGKGNKLPKRIKMLLDDYKNLGYTIHIQGDEDGTGDGTGYDKFQTYVTEGYLEKKNIFQFKYDFETAIPKKFLYQILLDFDYLSNVSFEQFDNKTKNGSINSSLENEFDINTNSNNLKIKIAKAVGNAAFHTNIYIEKKLQETELGKFILFLEQIR